MKTISSVLIVLIFLSSCAPSPIYRAETLQDNYIWRHGKQIGFYEDDDKLIFLSFAGIENNNAKFFLEVKNKSGKVIRVNPAESFVFYRTNHLDTSQFYTMRKALDPENEILAIEQKKKDRDASNLIIGIAALVAITAVAVAVASNNDDNSSSNSCDHDSAPPIVYVGSDDSGNDVDPLEQRKNSVSSQYFRISDNYPNETFNGYIEFPFADVFPYIYANIVIGGQAYSFGFRLAKH